ncbi:hypothetical protein L915_14951 [Phytophthora nicotianae]|uniref:Uncharacterized protein n=1 Tax=Phytophthora nicotianae TaxID=4792 RepID=W2G7Y1_PHYNI|nr:hypothetical protein L915_14951 [Phytophthora nicotianae]
MCSATGAARKPKLRDDKGRQTTTCSKNSLQALMRDSGLGAEALGSENVDGLSVCPRQATFAQILLGRTTERATTKTAQLCHRYLGRFLFLRLAQTRPRWTSCFAGSLSCHPLAETWQSRVVVPGFTSSRANTEHPRRKSLKQSLNDSFVCKFLIRFVLAICCDFNMTWYSLLQVVSPASIADTSGVRQFVDGAKRHSERRRGDIGPCTIPASQQAAQRGRHSPPCTASDSQNKLSVRIHDELSARVAVLPASR